MFPERAQQRASGLEPPSLIHRASTVPEMASTFQTPRMEQPRMDVGMSMKILANPSAPPPPPPPPPPRPRAATPSRRAACTPPRRPPLRRPPLPARAPSRTRSNTRTLVAPWSPAPPPQTRLTLNLTLNLTLTLTLTLTPIDAATMGTLNGALKMGQLDMSEFIEEDGPSALLDVVAEVTCKPKMSWLDLEVLVGALENLWELISNEDGARVVIETAHAIDRLVACLGITEGRARIKALEILSCLVVLTDQPVIEMALRKGGRGGMRWASQLLGILRDSSDASTCTHVMKLLNTLVACATNKAS